MTVDHKITVIRTVLDGMRAWQFSGEVPIMRGGLCSNTDNLLEDTAHPDDAYGYMHELRNRAFTTWPHFSGDKCYPVPSLHAEVEPGEMYDSVIYMWATNTEYGELRWALLDHVISEFEKELISLL